MKHKRQRSILPRLLLLTAFAGASSGVGHAAEYFWSGGTGTYNNPAGWGGTVPGPGDDALNNSGLANILQINPGDPDWTVSDLTAGGSAEGVSGAIEQNGQVVTVNSWLHIGAGTNATGVYTLNGGTLNVRNGRLFLGEAPGTTATLNINGGVLNKSGDIFTIADGGWNGPGERTGTVNQNGGVVNSTSEIWIGQVSPGLAFYNLHAGSINSSNWFVVARSGSTGTLNMDGGSILQVSGGQPAFIVADNGVGTLNFSAGSISTIGAEFWIGNGNDGVGTNNMSGTASLLVDNWIAVGRGGLGVLNLSGGWITKTGNGNLIMSGEGIINQTGGAITNLSGDTWIPEGGRGTWNLDDGVAILGRLELSHVGGAQGFFNLNGGLLRATEITTGSFGSYSEFNFNGGTLQAGANNANFLHDVAVANVHFGGAVIDSQDFDVTIPQALNDAGGGLTKLGTGTLRLTGANSYSGATVVSAGKLVVSGASAAFTDYSVADGATLGIGVLDAGSQANVQSATLGNTTGATLDFDLGAFGNPATAVLNVSGALTVNGVITVNVASSLPQLGNIPLITYGTRAGSGSFVIGSLPVGVEATIVTNEGTSSIELAISSINVPRWDGQAGGTWDIGVTENWVNVGTGNPTTYADGNIVLFDDNAQGTTTVNLTTTVSPGSVTAENNNLNYTLTGSGKIAGSTGFVKEGTGTFTISNTGGNTYTGPTVITGGTLAVDSLANGGSPSSIGASSSNPTNLIISDATLSYIGSPVATDRGYQIQNTNSTINVENNLTLSGVARATPGSGFVKTGPAQLAYTTVGSNQLSAGALAGYHVVEGTVLFDGTAGNQVNFNQNEFWVGSTEATGASLVLSNTFLHVTSWLGVGRGNGNIGNTSSVSLYNSAINVGNTSFGWNRELPENFAFQTLTLNGNSSFTNRGDSNLGESGGSTATININDSSVFYSANRVYLGMNGGSTGVLTVANSGIFRVNNGWFSVGNGNDGSGTALFKDNANLFVASDLNVTDTGTSIGSLTLQDNAVASGNRVFIGKASGSQATLNISGSATLRSRADHFRVAQTGGSVGNVTMSGGTVFVGNELWVGESGTGNWTQTGGDVWSTNWVAIGRNNGGTGVYTISGGSLTELIPGSRMIVGSSGTGTLNVSGTAQVRSLGSFQVAENGSSVGTVNLDGGTITAPRVMGGAGFGTFNFNGGTLVAANGAQQDFMSGITTVNVKAGGAKINTGTNVVNVSQALLDGSGDGGLTKLGAGTLNLNGANTYTGATAVNEGRLGGSGTIAGPVNVASGAGLAPGSTSGIGTLTINNALTLASGSTTFVDVSLDGGVPASDEVTGLTSVSYAGTLVVSNVGTNALEAGSVFKVFNAASSSGNFTSVTVLPSGSATFNPATGEVTITGTGSLAVGSATLQNGNLILTGEGGVPGTGYTWLTSTNVADPLASWTTNSTGVFDSNGAFSNAIPVNPSEPARFFRLRQP